MSTPQGPTGAFAALCEKELEILHLLASGHTAKSIATRLGRSETSINERLREARRKTGIGSSRELARMVAAQKIWDKNIDLPARPAGSNPSTATPRLGRQWSKGNFVMFATLSLAVLGLMVGSAGTDGATALETPAAGTHVSAPSLAGRWSLDVARIPADERPRSVVIGFALDGDGRWTTDVEIVSADGSRSVARSTAAADGRPVAVEGTMSFLDSASLRQPSPNTLVMTLGKGGKPLSTRVYTVASDGRSMTETIIWAAGGLPALETTYFTRVG